MGESSKTTVMQLCEHGARPCVDLHVGPIAGGVGARLVPVRAAVAVDDASAHDAHALTGVAVHGYIAMGRGVAQTPRLVHCVNGGPLMKYTTSKRRPNDSNAHAQAAGRRGDQELSLSEGLSVLI